MRVFLTTVCALALALSAGAAVAQKTEAQKQADAKKAAEPPFVVGQPVPPPGPPGPRLAGLPDPYRVDNNWAKMPPGRIWGSTTGVDIDKDGKSVWFAERCDSSGPGCADPKNKNMDPILKFDTNGKLVKSFGAGMFHYPHGMDVDANGNLWIADGIANPGQGKPMPPGNIGNTVREFSPDGKLLMTLGKPGVIGSGHDHYVFRAATAVAVAPNGDIYVGDGHDENGNNRVIKYDKNGKYLLEFGKNGKGPAEFLQSPHDLAIDKEGRVYVADRGNAEIQVFDVNGKLLHVWDQFGEPSGVYIRNEILYVADNGYLGYAKPGFNGQGVRIGRVSDGKLIANIPWGEYNTWEGVAVDKDGVVIGGFANKPGAHRFFPTGPLPK